MEFRAFELAEKSWNIFQYITVATRLRALASVWEPVEPFVASAPFERDGGEFPSAGLRPGPFPALLRVARVRDLLSALAVLVRDVVPPVPAAMPRA